MKLDEAIVTNLAAAEQAALAAGLGVLWADLPGDTPAARVAALVEALARAGRAADLAAALALACPAVPWAELPWPTATHRRLHAALCRRHSLDGLRTLCFRLGLDFDDLPGETKSARARELILAMERLGRLDELLLWEAGRSRGDLKGRARRRSWTAAPVAPRVARVAPRVARVASRLVRLLPFVLALALPVADGRIPGAVEREATAVTSGESGNANVITAVKPGDPTATPTATAPSPAAPSPAALSPATLSPAALSPAAQSPAASIPSPLPAFVLVGPRGANLRAGPGPEYPVVATLRAGARLALRGVNPTGEWYQVRYPGHGSPWIDAAHVGAVSGTGGLPVNTAEPWRPAATVSPPGSPAPAGGHTVPPSPTPRPTVTAPAVPLPAPTVPVATAPPP